VPAGSGSAEFPPDPDLTLAVLAFIRKRWFGRRSKSPRIQQFLATTTGFRVFQHSKEKVQWSMTDGEIAGFHYDDQLASAGDGGPDPMVPTAPPEHPLWP
jgi:hypothetical protein